MSETMRDRLHRSKFHSSGTKLGSSCNCDAMDWKCEDAVLAFAESEVRRAQQPPAPSRQPVPGLPQAEQWLAELNRTSVDDGIANTALSLLTELDRLRNLVRSLGGTP